MLDLAFCIVLSVVLCALLALTGHDIGQIFLDIGGVPLLPLARSTNGVKDLWKI
jgi:hypothetical protein